MVFFGFEKHNYQEYPLHSTPSSACCCHSSLQASADPSNSPSCLPLQNKKDMYIKKQEKHKKKGGRKKERNVDQFYRFYYWTSFLSKGSNEHDASGHKQQTKVTNGQPTGRHFCLANKKVLSFATFVSDDLGCCNEPHLFFLTSTNQKKICGDISREIFPK